MNTGIMLLLVFPVLGLAVVGFNLWFDEFCECVEKVSEKEKKMKKKKLKEIVAELQDRVDVLEFKEKAKGERIINEGCLFAFLSANGKKVVRAFPPCKGLFYYGVTTRIKGDYIEIYEWRSNPSLVYTIMNDEFVQVDLNTYLKAQKLDSLKSELSELKDKINV